MKNGLSVQTIPNAWELIARMESTFAAAKAELLFDWSAALREREGEIIRALVDGCKGIDLSDVKILVPESELIGLDRIDFSDGFSGTDLSSN